MVQWCSADSQPEGTPGVTRTVVDKLRSSTLRESWFANMTRLPSVVSCLKCTRMSAIVLSFHWGHEELLGVDLRAAIVWLEN